MSIRTTSRLMIAFGLVMLFVAIGMDTTVGSGYSRVHNMGLISQQQNFLIIGGIIFIAGIVLFATAKLKQTPDEDLTEKAKSKAQVERYCEIYNMSFTDMMQSIPTWWGNLDNKKGRVYILIYCAIASSAIVGFYSSTYIYSAFYESTKLPISKLEYLVFIGLTLYSLRSAPASRVMKHQLGFIAALGVLNSIYVFFSFVNQWEQWATNATVVSLSLVIISIGIIWKINHSEKRKLRIASN